MKANLLILTSFLFLTSCADFTTPRSFVDEMDRESDGFWVAGKDFPVVAGDSGSPYRSREEVVLRTPLNEKQKERMQYRDVLSRQLAEREENLSEDERARYDRDSIYLSTTSEKLYYLSLSPRERGDYLVTKSPTKGRRNTQLETSEREVAMRSPASLRDEVVLGMTKSEVKQLWGRPSRVDVAGDPRNQNERWVFFDGGRMKQIYFESGKVEGWSLE